jgi:hypothetical protein
MKSEKLFGFSSIRINGQVCLTTNITISAATTLNAEMQELRDMGVSVWHTPKLVGRKGKQKEKQFIQIQHNTFDFLQHSAVRTAVQLFLEKVYLERIRCKYSKYHKSEQTNITPQEYYEYEGLNWDEPTEQPVADFNIEDIDF